MFIFRKIWRALFSWNNRFGIRPFALLPTQQFNSAVNNIVSNILLTALICNPCNPYIPIRHLLVQSQQWKQQNNVWNLIKVNNRDNRDTRTTLLTSGVFIVNFELIHTLFWCFHWWLWTSFESAFTLPTWQHLLHLLLSVDQLLVMNKKPETNHLCWILQLRFVGVVRPCYSSHAWGRPWRKKRKLNVFQ